MLAALRPWSICLSPPVHGRGLDLAALQREMDRAEERWNLRKEEEEAAAAEAKEAKE